MESLPTNLHLMRSQKNKEFAENIITGTHNSWKKLMSQETDGKGISLTNSSLGNSSSVSGVDASLVVSGQPEQGEDQPLPEGVHKWHYVSLK